MIVHDVHESREGESPPIPRGISRTKPIDAAKEKVTVLELAERLVGGPLTRKGDSFTARCPLPDHEDKTPSFTVYADNGRGWTCFGCRRGGDVVHLFALAHGHDNLGVAAGYLLLDFGHELPQRTPSWFRRQERQGPIREGIEQMRVRRLQYVLFAMVEPFVADVRDAERTWEECWTLAVSWYERMRSEREEAEHG